MLEDLSATETGALFAVFGLMLVSIALGYTQRENGSILAAVVNRWVRWITFSIGLALLLRVAELDGGRPLWVWSAVFFFGWFLIETVNSWLFIQAWSRSEIPLFHRFEENNRRDEWPAGRPFLKLRERLRAARFSHRQALKARITDEVLLRVSVFEDEAALTRLSIVFLSEAAHLTAIYSFVSLSTEGRRIVTDNRFQPFPGYYPDNWSVMRKPLERNWDKLLKQHRSHVESLNVELARWQEDPMDDLNAQEKLLEEVNTQLGIVNPRYLREEHGKITDAGRYRIWKEVWFLKYLGMTLPH